MEDVTCLLCGHSERRIKYKGRDRLHHVPGTFTLVECARCGFLYLSPRPDGVEIQRYYPRDYMPFRPALHEERSALRRLDRLVGLRKRCGVILRHKSDGHLLDIGCGTGDFLATMQSYQGWQVRGLEPQAEAVRRAREKYGLEVDQTFLDEASYPPGRFDVVTLWDVFEHVPRPWRSLGQIHEMLRPDGLVVIGLPNRDSMDARLFGPYWAGLDVPRHYSVFSAKHVTRLLLESGFRDPRVFNLNGGYHSFALSVDFWLDEWGSKNWRRSLLRIIVNSLPFRLGTYPYFLALKWLRRGSTMIVVARKA